MWEDVKGISLPVPLSPAAFFPYLGEKVLFWLKSERFPCLKIACTPMSTPTKYYDKKKQRVIYNLLILLVGAARFELATPCAQGRCATRLRYAPTPSLYHGRKITGKNNLGMRKTE
jgi:hypothetical protein